MARLVKKTLLGEGDVVELSVEGGIYLSENGIFNHNCSECTELHTTDGTTPRLWRLSEVESGYHKKGSGRPSIKSLHPHDRCSMVTLLPGWGFDSGGRATYISVDHDAMKEQRGDSSG